MWNNLGFCVRMSGMKRLLGLTLIAWAGLVWASAMGPLPPVNSASWYKALQDHAK